MEYPLSTNTGIADNAFIAETASIIGDVSIGTSSSIWYGAVLRGDIQGIIIGNGTNIQDNATIHVGFKEPAVIGDYVSVGHNAIVHGAVIEDNVLIGMHATVLTGAVVGTNSIIAAGAIVPEGTIIPPDSVVMGVPGKIKYQTTEKQAEDIKHNALSYVELIKAYQ